MILATIIGLIVALGGGNSRSEALVFRIRQLAPWFALLALSAGIIVLGTCSLRS